MIFREASCESSAGPLPDEMRNNAVRGSDSHFSLLFPRPFFVVSSVILLQLRSSFLCNSVEILETFLSPLTDIRQSFK